MGSMDAYEGDFEVALLSDTAAYYSRKAASWIMEDSCPDYMLKVGEIHLFSGFSLEFSGFFPGFFLGFHGFSGFFWVFMGFSGCTNI